MYYIYISMNEPTLVKDEIRDTRARVYLIGECGRKRSCHGLLTGPLPHQPAQPPPTLPTPPPTPRTRPPCAPLPRSCGMVVRRRALTSLREPVVDRRRRIARLVGGPRGGAAADRNRSTKTTHSLPLNAAPDRANPS